MCWYSDTDTQAGTLCPHPYPTAPTSGVSLHPGPSWGLQCDDFSFIRFTLHWGRCAGLKQNRFPFSLVVYWLPEFKAKHSFIKKNKKEPCELTECPLPSCPLTVFPSDFGSLSCSLCIQVSGNVPLGPLPLTPQFLSPKPYPTVFPPF